MCENCEAERVLRAIDLGPLFELTVSHIASPTIIIRLRLSFPTPDVRTGEPTEVYASTMIAHTESEEDILRLVRRQCHMLLLHEADEWFRYQGKQIFDPHRRR